MHSIKGPIAGKKPDFSRDSAMSEIDVINRLEKKRGPDLTLPNRAKKDIYVDGGEERKGNEREGMLVE